MAFRAPHEIHTRRFGRNAGLGIALVVMIALTFALTVVKVTRGDPMRAFDHQVRPELLPKDAVEEPEGS